MYLMVHAVVNAALSLAKGENALAGASSAVTAEAVGLISKEYYDKNPSELDELQKQKISALASLAAGLAGGLVGGDTASAVSGAQTGKVTVENNALSDNKPGHDEVELEKEHGNLPLKIHKINPLQIGQVDDEGNTLLAGGKVKWPVKETNAGKGTATNSVASELTGVTQKQLDKKFKHAADFGITTTKKNSETLSQYEAAIKSHMGDTATKSQGTYGFVTDSKVFFNPNTNNAVVLDKSGNFVTGFKLTPGTPQYDNYMKNGVLR